MEDMIKVIDVWIGRKVFLSMEVDGEDDKENKDQPPEALFLDL